MILVIALREMESILILKNLKITPTYTTLIKNERLVTYSQIANVAMHTIVIRICCLSISQMTVRNMYDHVELVVEAVN